MICCQLFIRREELERGATTSVSARGFMSIDWQQPDVHRQIVLLLYQILYRDQRQASLCKNLVNIVSGRASTLRIGVGSSVLP